MSAPAPSMYSPAAKSIAENLGLVLGRANLEELAEEQWQIGAVFNEKRREEVVRQDETNDGQ